MLLMLLINLRLLRCAGCMNWRVLWWLNFGQFFPEFLLCCSILLGDLCDWQNFDQVHIDDVSADDSGVDLRFVSLLFAIR